MKLVRFGNPGTEKPELVDDQARLRDLSDVIADVTPANLSRSALQKIAAIAPSTLPLVAGEPRFGVPAVCSEIGIVSLLHRCVEGLHVDVDDLPLAGRGAPRGHCLSSVTSPVRPGLP